ncbi:MAG: FKBP-type peptidyl-prolyl cis-trans isomerase [Bifidobacteriaceae bacterium]|jgi:peptidylprolyl isomerase|nr:FKBP-type peptidyl-prolyl cis-trans isomerase [Bifidobacteriaceae bacterium]
MKKLLALAAALALSLAAASCGGNPGDVDGDGASSAPSSGPLAAVQWVDGSPPSLDFSTPFDLGQDSAFRVVKAGDGAEVKIGDSIQLAYLIVAGQDGTVLASTYEANEPMPYTVAEEASEGDYVWQAVYGQAVGANVIAAFRSEPQAAADASASPVAPQTYLVGLTIVSILPERAEGETVAPDDPNLPAVTLDQNGKPSINVPAGANPPAELVSQILIRGSGPEVDPTQSVTANYSGWLWDGTLFDSSWERGQPSSFSLQEVIAGWTQGLAGVPVGSQVLLVVPPDLGYGDDDTNSQIPPGSTLIFVVDVLASP